VKYSTAAAFREEDYQGTGACSEVVGRSRGRRFAISQSDSASGKDCCEVAARQVAVVEVKSGTNNSASGWIAFAG
jgi:hypothetical protein